MDPFHKLVLALSDVLRPLHPHLDELHEEAVRHLDGDREVEREEGDQRD